MGWDAWPCAYARRNRRAVHVDSMPALGRLLPDALLRGSEPGLRGLMGSPFRFCAAQKIPARALVVSAADAGEGGFEGAGALAGATGQGVAS